MAGATLGGIGAAESAPFYLMPPPAEQIHAVTACRLLLQNGASRPSFRTNPQVDRLGKAVKKGELLAVVNDFFANPLAEVRAPFDGILLGAGRKIETG